MKLSSNYSNIPVGRVANDLDLEGRAYDLMSSTLSFEETMAYLESWDTGEPLAPELNSKIEAIIQQSGIDSGKAHDYMLQAALQIYESER